jgi:hypothetical protein
MTLIYIWYNPDVREHQCGYKFELNSLRAMSENPEGFKVIEHISCKSKSHHKQISERVKKLNGTNHP